MKGEPEKKTDDEGNNKSFKKDLNHAIVEQERDKDRRQHCQAEHHQQDAEDTKGDLEVHCQQLTMR